MEEIINRVSASDIITLNLEDYYQKGERIQLDIKDNLFQGLVLKEKDFREFIKTTNWADYQNKLVAIFCSVDAIIPTWAYMLLASSLQPYAKQIVFGDLNALEQYLFHETLGSLKVDQYKGKKVVIKGCGQIPIPDFAFVELTKKLRPYVFSLMYGEPCSTVPIFKKGSSSLQK